MQSDIAKSDGITSDLKMRWPSRHVLGQNLTARSIAQLSVFGPKSDDSAHRILESKNGIDL